MVMWLFGIAAVAMSIFGVILSKKHWREFWDAANGIASEYNHQYIYDDDDDKEA